MWSGARRRARAQRRASMELDVSMRSTKSIGALHCVGILSGGKHVPDVYCAIARDAHHRARSPARKRRGPLAIANR